MMTYIINTLNMHIPHPLELLRLPRWCMWKYLGKQKKPYQVSGQPAKVNNLDHWSSYEEVASCSQKGFLFVKEDRLTGIDIDKCRDPETGELSELAQYILRIFVGAYAEISPSGTGIKLWVRGNKPDWCTRVKKNFDDGQSVEIYDDKHYFTVTGNALEKPLFIASRESDLCELCEEYFQQPTKETFPREVQEPGLEDQEILDKLFSFSYGDKVRDLYQGRWGKYYASHSEADLAFCGYLSFMTKDKDAINRIVSSSGLYRDKWDRDDYRARTIDKALDSQEDSYSTDSKLFLRETIIKMALETLFSPFPYRQSGDLLTKLDLLATAYKAPLYKGNHIQVSTSHRDLQILKNEPDVEHISRSVHRLDNSDQIIIQETGNAGKSSTYLIPMKSPTLPILDISTYLSNTTTIINNNTVFNLMLPEVRFLSYSSLNSAFQRSLLVIALQTRISISELKKLVRYTGTKQEFLDAVIHPLRRAKLINLDYRSKRFVNIRKDWRENLQKMFDKEKLEELKRQIAKERKDHMENFLHKPMQEMMDEFFKIIEAK